MHNPYQAPVADLDSEVSAPSNDVPQPAGFWRRVGAHLIDTLIMLPIIGFTFWASAQSRNFYAIWLLPSLLIGAFYSIYLVHRLGGTPGKKVMKLRIQMADGAPISARAAVVRAAAIMLLAAVSTAAQAVAAASLDDGSYYGLGFLERSEALNAASPLWGTVAGILMQVWIWGSLVVLLVNQRRRAVHDFLAGTVVVNAGPAQG
jgi:uncharacterized RDD family membrane protein YckC